ncbi:hypothetical protein [Kitasatospora sp. NE20-6]
MKFRLLGAVAADGDDGGPQPGPEKRRSLLTGRGEATLTAGN